VPLNEALQIISAESINGRPHGHLSLRLPRGLGDLEPDRHVLLGAAIVEAAHRGSAEIIEADGDTDILVGGAHAVRGVEADPAEAGHMRFRPGIAAPIARPVACRLFRPRECATAMADIASDKTRWHPESARDRDEDMGEVPGLAASCLESVGRRWGGPRRR
jgi:hypothetical protein